MIITKQWIDNNCPEHGRTSCNDNNLCNGTGGWTGKYNSETGAHEILFPRCNRCYLLRHIGEDTEELEFVPEIELFLRYNR